MTKEEINNIISQISYKPGWNINLYDDKINHPSSVSKLYIQIFVDERSDSTLDSVKKDGTRVAWKSGKRYISQFMCRQEVVGIVFDLIKAAELHEVHEWFRYKNASIFNPHLDPDKLAEFASKKDSFCVRENSMTVA